MIEESKPTVEISKEKLGTVLAATKRRLEFMGRKIERFDELKDTLTPEELRELWDGVLKFTGARDEFDNLLTKDLNKDRKI